MRDCIKFGPADRNATVAYLAGQQVNAEELVKRAEASVTGMASDGRWWVSVLVTMPGNYMVEKS